MSIRELNVDTTEVTTTPSTEIVASGAHCVSQQPLQEVTAVKKEYSIISDAFYASVNDEDAPAWLTNLINSIVEASVANGLTDYDLLVQDVRNAIDSIDVAKNTYVEQINFTSLVNGIVGTHLDTLNATHDGKFATIVNLDTVVATTEEALALSVTDLRAEFTSDINSRITTVENAYANADGALADSITALTTVYANQETDISGIADSITGIQNYVGLDGDDENPGVISESTWFTDLENSVNGPSGIVNTFAEFQVTNKAYIDDEVISAQSSFGYDSTIILGGKLYKSGFGLDVDGSVDVSPEGHVGDPIFSSKFRVNAETFVLTNPNHPNVEAQLEVTATGLMISADQTEATRNEPRGVYSAATTYVKGDIVSYAGGSYIALKSLIGVTPTNDNVNWQIMAEGGRGAANLTWSGALGNYTTSQMAASRQAALNDYWDSARNGSTALAQKVEGDTLTLTNTTSTASWSHIFTWSGTVWTALIAAQFAGSVIVDGTLLGNAISTTTSITAGSGSNTAVMSGSDSTYRFWAGAPTGASANFSVDKTGHLTSKSGEFSNGTFDDVVINESCTVNGDISGASGSFSGTIYAENIEGDVYDVIDKRFTGSIGQGSAVQNLFTGNIASASFDRKIKFDPIVLDVEDLGGAPIATNIVITIKYYIDNAEKGSYTSSGGGEALGEDYVVEIPYHVFDVAKDSAHTFKTTIDFDNSRNSTLTMQKASLVGIFRTGGSLS